jgi:hypothetical protein
MKSVALPLLALGSPLLLVASISGGPWAEWCFTLVVTLFPAALCFLGAAAGRDRKRWAPAALGLILPLSGAVLLLLRAPGRSAGRILGLPPATAWMLIGLGLIPLLLTGFGYAAEFRGARGDERTSGARGNGRGRKR